MEKGSKVLTCPHFCFCIFFPHTRNLVWKKNMPVKIKSFTLENENEFIDFRNKQKL